MAGQHRVVPGGTVRNPAGSPPLRSGSAAPGTTILASYWAPPGILTAPARRVVVLCGDNDDAPLPDPEAKPAGLPLVLLEHGLAVLRVDRFSTTNPTNQFANFYTTYNRTKLQARVRDLLTVCLAASTGVDPRGPRFFEVTLWGTGHAGLWALLAAPAAGGVVADCNQIDVPSDEAMLAPNVFCPGIRNIGSFEGGAMLAAPQPLLLHNTSTNFPTDSLRAAYRAVGASDALRIVAARLPEAELVRWVCAIRTRDCHRRRVSLRVANWDSSGNPHGLMKGIILAGGAGSRLFPLTLVASKQLQPVYDKPMVYYPLTTLIEGGIRELCLISTPQDLPRFTQLLGDGSAWGLSIEYREQPKPEGIAQAFLIAESFIGEEAVALILGDNVFYGGDSFYRSIADFKQGATIFGYHVNDPERYGVVEFDGDGQAISIQEKPGQPRSNYAVPGLYLYDNDVVAITRSLKPSARGELEITDVNVEYLRRKQLHVHRLSRGFAWLDAGTSSSLHEASAYVQTIEKRAGIKIGCPEEAAFRRGCLSLERLEALTGKMPKCEYREYLIEVIEEAKRLAALA